MLSLFATVKTTPGSVCSFQLLVLKSRFVNFTNHGLDTTREMDDVDCMVINKNQSHG